jgi:regulatory protein
MPIDAAKYEKLASFCSYQERCRQQVIEKALNLEINKLDIPQYLHALEQNNYLNEERFAASFIRGKQKHKSWGKLKIRLHLKQLGLAENTIDKVWENEIDPEVYKHTLFKIIEKKLMQLKGKNPTQIKQSCFRFAQSKGYHKDEILRTMQQLGIL